MGSDGPVGTRETTETLKKSGLESLRTGRALMVEFPSTDILRTDLETAEKLLQDGIFYQQVSSDEKLEIYKAMQNEFVTTGHWYTCPQGHYFTIGECGRAIQIGHCPECGEAVGGEHHQALQE